MTSRNGLYISDGTDAAHQILQEQARDLAMAHEAAKHHAIVEKEVVGLRNANASLVIENERLALRVAELEKRIWEMEEKACRCSSS